MAEAPRKPQWTDATDAEADAFFATLTEAEIRKRQDLCQQQIELAYKYKNEIAMIELRRMEDALTRAMLARF